MHAEQSGISSEVFQENIARDGALGSKCTRCCESIKVLLGLMWLVSQPLLRFAAEADLMYWFKSGRVHMTREASIVAADNLDTISDSREQADCGSMLI